MNILRNSRYHLNPKHLRYIRISPVVYPTYSAICSSGLPLFHLYFAQKLSKSYLLCNFSTGSNPFLLSDFSSYVSSCFSRNCSSFAVNNNSSDTSRKESGNLGVDEGSVNVIKRIIDIVKNDASDMESRLDLMGMNLSKGTIIEVFYDLNQLNVPALRFFDWIKSAHSRYSRNADICSLAIDNCGRLGDFGALRGLLKDFHLSNICLSEKAFAFLSIADDTGESAKKSITDVVVLLNEVGGSCRSSGIHSLITMLCSSDLMDLAKFVLEITEKKASYYNVLVKHLCVRGHLKDAQDMISEMSQFKCDMNYTPYNYLISSLCVRGRIDEACSIPKEMINRECLPNELTFEILIYFTCRYGRSDDAINLLNEMLSSGIKPRLPTHIAFIRGYVSGRHFDKAYKYVVELAAIDKLSGTQLYNVLASLHIELGDLLLAYKLLIEMLEKGFNPKFSVYRRASICLCETGRAELAKTLDASYSSLVKELR